MLTSPIRNLDDGHLSALDFEAIQDNLKERLAELESRATDSQRSLEVTPGEGVITYPMLISSEQHGETGEIFNQLPNFDGITMITGIEPLMLAGMPCIKSPTGNEGIDLYFVASAVDDVKDVASGQNGFRSGAPMNVKVCARVHGYSTGGGDNLQISYVSGSGTTETALYESGGDTWWQLNAAGRHGQSFTVPAWANGSPIKSVSLYLKRNNDDFGRAYVALTSVSGEIPHTVPGDGVILRSSHILTYDLSPSGDWVEFVFSEQLPKLVAGDVYQIRIFGDPSVSVYLDNSASAYAGGNASKYDAVNQQWDTYPNSDLYMKLKVYNKSTNGFLLDSGQYHKWQDVFITATMIFNHGLYSDEGYADFKIHIPGEMALNALCIQDKTTGGELHWRCGHVRTRHINPHMAFPLNIDNGMTLTADGEGGMSWQSPFVPGFWTSTNWEDSPKTGANGVIDLSEEFGLPDGIKAVAVRFTIRGNTAGTYARLSATSGSLNAGLVTRVQVAGQAVDTGGIVPCDDNGDIYFSQGAALTGVWIYVSGYFK